MDHLRKQAKLPFEKIIRIRIQEASQQQQLFRIMRPCPATVDQGDEHLSPMPPEQRIRVFSFR